MIERYENEPHGARRLRWSAEAPGLKMELTIEVERDRFRTKHVLRSLRTIGGLHYMGSAKPYRTPEAAQKAAEARWLKMITWMGDQLEKTN